MHNEEINELLDHCRNYAEDLLMETGELFPFGALMDADGRSHHREVEVDPKHIPSNGEIIEMLLEYFEEEYNNNDARAFAIACEAGVQLDGNSSTDAISVDIRHKEVADIPIYYFPFNLSGNGEVKFGEAFAVKR
jgi:hypothetical protein